MKKNQRHDNEHSPQPQNNESSAIVENAFDSVSLTLDGEREYKPLRKKLKSTTTGEESNFVPSYSLQNSWSNKIKENDAQLIRLENHIEAEGINVSPPFHQFIDLNLPTPLLRTLSNLGFLRPTPIQMQSIPCIMNGRDVIALADTGSGKTLSYLLPAIFSINRTLKARFASNLIPGKPVSLILVPTRELVTQVLLEMKKLVVGLDGNYSKTPPIDDMYVQTNSMRILGICGGILINHQIKYLSLGVEMIISTPGRLLDLAQRKQINLSELSYLVMDEVDKMLDLNMENQMRVILGLANAVGRQTLIWSATLPHGLERLARSAVMNPITIRVKMGKMKSGLTSDDVHQEVIFMNSKDKKSNLLNTLREIERPPVLIFCNLQSTVDYVTKILRHEQFHAVGLHSGKHQEYRLKIMEAFREGYLDILVATDIASRGIDISNIQRVILYDTPNSIQDYVHRCGRVGRAGKKGKATTFLTFNCTIAAELKQVLRESKQKVPLELENTSRFGKNKI